METKISIDEFGLAPQTADTVVEAKSKAPRTEASRINQGPFEQPQTATEGEEYKCQET